MEPDLGKFDFERELPAQRRLFVECFPENEGTPVVTNEHYLWKFQKSPNNPHSYEYGTWIDGEIAGYYAAISYPYNYFGNKVEAGMVCDVMTGLKARGKGVFTRLGSYSISEIKKSGPDFITGFPIRKEVIPGHRKTGWNFPFKIPMYGKFLSMKSFLDSKRLPWLNYLFNPALALFNKIINAARDKRKGAEFSCYSSCELGTIDGLEEFLERWRKDIPISLIKNLDFLKWRLGAPGKDYTIILMKTDNQINGYAVGRIVVKQGVKCFGIMDLCIAESYIRYSSLMLREIEREALRQEGELLLIMMLRKYASRYRFLRNGWIRTPFSFSFITQKTSNIVEVEKLVDEKNWFLTWIDSDDL